MIYTCTAFGMFYFFPGVFFHFRMTGACLVTTDLIIRVNVRTTTATYMHLYVTGFYRPTRAFTVFHCPFCKPITVLYCSVHASSAFPYHIAFLYRVLVLVACLCRVPFPTTRLLPGFNTHCTPSLRFIAYCAFVVFLLPIECLHRVPFAAQRTARNYL